MSCKVCKSPATLICGSCLLTKYCSEECGRHDWEGNKHSFICKPFSFIGNDFTPNEWIDFFTSFIDKNIVKQEILPRLSLQERKNLLFALTPKPNISTEPALKKRLVKEKWLMDEIRESIRVGMKKYIIRNINQWNTIVNYEKFFVDDYDRVKYITKIGVYLKINVELKDLSNNNTLRNIEIESNNVGNNGAIALADALKSNSTLTHLVLNDNNIEKNGVKAIANALRSNSSLTLLDLKHNQFGDLGATDIAEMLSVNSTLVTLDLTDTNITQSGAINIAKSLQKNSTLTSLSFYNNNAGIEGAKAFANTLKINSTLVDLDLSSNKIQDEGVAALADALKTNSTLISLYLMSNLIGEYGARTLNIALRKNTSLKTLILRRNNFDNETKNVLENVYKYNSTLTRFEF